MKTKINIENLEIGMYVCELDRPWLETNFSLQGFVINSEEQLNELKKQCQYVYIQAEENINSVAISLNKQTTKEPSEKIIYSNQYHVEREYLTAITVRKELLSALQLIRNNIINLQPIKINVLQSTLIAMVDSMVRDPNAMLLLTRFTNNEDDFFSHAINGSIFMVALGRYLNYSKEQLLLLATAGILRDIGLVLQTKEDALESHVIKSIEVLENLPDIAVEIVEMIKCHHEYYDGSGYPQHLKEKQISTAGAIAALADYYDNLVTSTAENPAISYCKALQQIHATRDTLFDATLVEQFIQCMGVYPVGSFVELNTGEKAIVIEQNNLRKLKPKILIIQDAQNKPLNHITINLLHEPLNALGQPYTIKKNLEAEEVLVAADFIVNIGTY